MAINWQRERASHISVGSRVAFSREFCRNTGQITGWTPFARGKVVWP